MSKVDELKVRYVVQAKLLGQDKEAQKRGKVSASRSELGDKINICVVL